MEINISKFRANYKAVANKINRNQWSPQLTSEIKSYQEACRIEQQSIINNAQYQYLEEVQFYIERYEQLINLSDLETNQQISHQNVVNESKNIVNVSPPSFQQNNNSNVIENNKSRIFNNTQNRQPNYNVSPQREALNNFFSSKQGQSNQGLQSVLNSPSTSLTKTFKTKINQNQEDLNSLYRINEELKNRLKFSRSENPSEYESRTYDNNKLHIHKLEEQNSNLSRENTILRSERTTVVSDISHDDDYLYSPYHFTTQTNNIYELNLKNYKNEVDKEDVSEQSDFTKNEVIYRKVGYEYENYTEVDYENERNMQNNFSIFDINRSIYSDSANEYQTQSKVQQKTYMRNKTAFFKPKGIILKNEEIEIGYKRSPLSSPSAIRIILYFNNKTSNNKEIHTKYEYEQDYYEINVTERIRSLPPFSQAREVIEVKLRGNGKDFNSVAEVLVEEGSGNNRHKTERIWLPIMFINPCESANNDISGNGEVSKSVYPSKIFSSPLEAKKIIEFLKITGNNKAEFYCESAKGNGLVKMEWKQEKLKVTSSALWIDFITFLMIENV